MLFIPYINDYMAKPILHFRGPSLILLATVHFLIFVAGLVTASALRHGAHFATPFAPAEELRAFLALSPTAVQSQQFLPVWLCDPLPESLPLQSSVACASWAFGPPAQTSRSLGGLIATIALILSGSVGWILSVPEVLASAQIVKAVNFLNFLLGGVVFAVGFGLLTAGVSVTCYFMRLLPRWPVGLGMLLALTGELSSLSLVAYPANFFIPITRYLGFIWMFSVAVALTRDRKGAQPASIRDSA